jgi:hypothetical protein
MMALALQVLYNLHDENPDPDEPEINRIHRMNRIRT